MAKPFKEGKTWAYRLRIRGEDIYEGGFLTEASAKKAEAEKKVELRNAEYAPGKSPYNTSVAAAFTLYAKQRLPYGLPTWRACTPQPSCLSRLET